MEFPWPRQSRPGIPVCSVGSGVAEEESHSSPLASCCNVSLSRMVSLFRSPNEAVGSEEVLHVGDKLMDLTSDLTPPLLINREGHSLSEVINTHDSLFLRVQAASIKFYSRSIRG